MSDSEKKARASISRDYDTKTNTVSFVAKDGETVSHQLDCNMALLTVPLHQMAAAAGIIQSVGDCSALPADKATGKPATMDQKFAAMKARWDFLLTGEGWVKKVVAKTPEQKAAELEALVKLAFAACSKQDFEKYIETSLANTAAAGVTGATRASVIEGMRRMKRLDDWIRQEEAKKQPAPAVKVELPSL